MRKSAAFEELVTEKSGLEKEQAKNRLQYKEMLLAQEMYVSRTYWVADLRMTMLTIFAMRRRLRILNEKLNAMILAGTDYVPGIN